MTAFFLSLSRKNTLKRLLALWGSESLSGSDVESEREVSINSGEIFLFLVFFFLGGVGRIKETDLLGSL